ncbi:MAG: TniQ family protein [Rhizorhabdus sp.]|uniref:TniQ family protein n=1 Tax=Rhizorhabdus sp. TaxID=1968843 RepID=UPI001B6A5F36|nr:TniQ family protein [Rhizorhabdus sp.]MBP8231557.1 TniQ family protein [Rhizorhabdus sp.]
MENRDRFAIEVLEQGYEDVVDSDWPVRFKLQPDELLSSWLHAVTLANGISLLQFGRFLGLNGAPRLRTLDYDCPDWMWHLLVGEMRLPEHLAAALLVDERLETLLLQEPRAPQHGGITWLQYCPACWSEDTRPYFRRHWRLATLLHCRQHYKALKDQCPRCRFGIGFPQGDVLHEIHLCRRCGYDLSRARPSLLDRLAERSSRAIDDLLLYELNGEIIERTRLREQLLYLPTSVFGYGSGHLTRLSVQGRSVLYREIMFSLNQYLPTSADEPAREWRRFLLDNAGRAGKMIEMVDPEDERPRPARQRQLLTQPFTKKFVHIEINTSMYDLLKSYGDFLVRRGGPFPSRT